MKPLLWVRKPPKRFKNEWEPHYLIGRISYHQHIAERAEAIAAHHRDLEAQFRAADQDYGR